MAERTMGLCRVDNGAHWCAECCDGRNCPSLGNLPDGSWGCLGWNLKKKTILETPDGAVEAVPQPKMCRDMDCLQGSGLTSDEAIKRIRALPAGEFFMSQIIEG